MMTSSHIGAAERRWDSTQFNFRGESEDGVKPPYLNIPHPERLRISQTGVPERLRPVRASAVEVGVEHKGEALTASPHTHSLVTAEHEELVGLCPAEYLKLVILIYMASIITTMQ